MKRTGASNFDDEGDADSMTEKSETDQGGIRRKRREPGAGASSVTAKRENSSPGRETLMEAVVEGENMRRAYWQVVRNKGAGGIDGMEVEELKPYLKAQWSRIKEELLEGRYKPQGTRTVEIPKPSGGMRQLGIPTVVDRLIQQALQQVLSPVFDKHFSKSSYGFRPKRNAQQAILQARGYVAEGKRWVVDIDLEKFFDRVNHDILMSLVVRQVKDRRILGLIRRYLQAGIMADGVIEQRTEGTCQGSPLSPLLSNIVLDELDKELERRGHTFCRYADDCNVYVRSRQAGERVMSSLKQFLGRRLRLQINEKKSAVARPWKRKFLGYSMTFNRQPKLKVAEESVKRFKEKVRELMRKGRNQKIGKTIEELRLLMRGWMEYFKLAQVKTTFEELDSWIRRKLRCILWRQWKRPYTRFKHLRQQGLDEMSARQSSGNGRGPWWNAGTSHMNLAFPKTFFDKMGLPSLLDGCLRYQL